MSIKRRIFMIFVFSLAIMGLVVGLILILRSKQNNLTIVETPLPSETSEQPTIMDAIPSPTPVRKKLLWGAFPGSTVESKIEFERRVGKEMNYVATFVHWGNEREFPASLADEAKSKNQTLLIYWEAMDYNHSGFEDSRFSYQAILRGDWDNYIQSFGDQIRAANQPIILIPFEEMNGNWSPWSISVNGNTAQEHKQAYQKIAKMYQDIPNLEMGWAVNQESVPDIPEKSIANLYPGNEYVDVVGVDGFNFGDTWLEPTQIFDDPVRILQGYGKPVMIFSTASAQDVKKAEWIKNLRAFLDYNPGISGFIWFNENKERDWRVWSDDNSLKAFQYLIE